MRILRPLLRSRARRGRGGGARFFTLIRERNGRKAATTQAAGPQVLPPGWGLGLDEFRCASSSAAFSSARASFLNSSASRSHLSLSIGLMALAASSRHT
jgi:hypothetical protein